MYCRVINSESTLVLKVSSATANFLVTMKQSDNQEKMQGGGKYCCMLYKYAAHHFTSETYYGHSSYSAAQK